MQEDLKAKRLALRGSIAELEECLQALQAEIDKVAGRIQRLAETRTWANDPNSGCWLKERAEELKGLQEKKKQDQAELAGLKQKYREITGREI
jgi:chromosome segregation ATPase